MANKINFKEGSINFWIPENVFDFDDNQTHILVNQGNLEGSIFIVKDGDNKLKFFHVLLGKGRTDVVIDVQELLKSEKHMITATWSISKKEINLYIDGGKKHNTTKITY
ncbi:hypothetical protein JXA48_01725 [Candidatus Woesearchaeota archaeon]|nr:hypothetical protein [Candidatus Woesearchaeota archaeon]